MDVDPDSKDRYLINTNNWVCSCPIFITNTYMVCKHLVKECSFFPQYATTRQRHDYPFILFGKVHASIDPANNPWTEMTEIPTDEESPRGNDSMDLDPQTRNELIESMRAELAEDERMFNSLLEIVSDNIQNNQFYHTYKRLRQVLMNKTQACEEALRARTQQRTWNPPHNSRLAFYLN